jgi:hypothetical protein
VDSVPVLGGEIPPKLTPAVCKPKAPLDFFAEGKSPPVDQPDPLYSSVLATSTVVSPPATKAAV